MDCRRTAGGIKEAEIEHSFWVPEDGRKDQVKAQGHRNLSTRSTVRNDQTKTDLKHSIDKNIL